MARDPLLKDALGALKDKIKNAAASASPEELAYLGTAINQIGGRATVLEVEEMGDIKIEELTTHADTVELAAITSITATKDASEASITAAKVAADAFISNSRDDAETYITTEKVAAETYITAEKVAAKAEVDVHLATAMNAASDAMGAVTQQFVYGAKSYFFSQM